jgi:predicted nucleotidyltransferase/DNA-binding HxlR family transcriptional regulator
MRASTPILADVLFGKLRGAVLALLYGHPDQTFYYRQIARHLQGSSAGSLQRELDTLSRVGLIERSNVGNQVHYRANSSHPVFAELRSLVAKTVGVAQVLRSALEPLRSRIIVAFIYGSVARHEESAGSDVDLLVLGEASLADVVDAVGETEAALGRAVNPTVYSPLEYKDKVAGGNQFLRSVAQGQKIFVIGSEDELAEVGGIRMGKARAD